MVRKIKKSIDKMKKTVCYLLIVTIIFVLISKREVVLGNSTNKLNNGEVGETSIQQSISSKLIRFHVIANSDSKEDQNLKLKIRDKVLEYIYPKLKNSKSINESRDILKKNDKTIKSIAEKIVKDNGYNYSVESMLSFENFPVKSYGNITLPQGKYEAYRIIIGKGNGQNWWCVMFPPLCFVDLSKGEVAEAQTESEMKKVLSKDEYNLINNKNDSKEIKIKFKIVELIRGFINRVSG